MAKGKGKPKGASKTSKFIKETGLSKPEANLWRVIVSGRKHLIEDDWRIIKEEAPDIEKELEEIRREFNIPSNLSVSSDAYVSWTSVGDNEVDLVESYWLNTHPSIKREIETRIETLLLGKGLVTDFFDLVWHWLLYREFPKIRPYFGFEYLYQVFTQPEEAEMVPPITEEKKFLEAQAKIAFGSKSEAFIKRRDIFNNAKNNRRRSRTLPKVLEEIKTSRELVSIKDKYGNDRVRPKTSKELIVELNPTVDEDNMPSKKEDESNASGFRTRKSRYLKRVKKYIKKNEK